ncbi:hypothetical protein DSO57_1005233 [Entomophthora muscae]|uniref:Uncharacterized protein n=1 Tax=Entomophthora muscae TaxID=34485 RepID=A0ACC2U631_9FUNG|nr:hypothetical protein DSO57_1005233 [Entomophthora muscae]
MTRGNQREKDRERAQKKQAQATKQKKAAEGGKTFRTKMESDAAIMREKQEKAAAAKEAARLAALGQGNSK